MGNKLYEETSVQAIANAIRSKLGTDAVFKIGDMATAVSSIPTGITPTGTLDIASNGTYDVTNYAKVSVTVPKPLYIMEPIEFDYTIGSVTINSGTATWTYNDEGVRRSDIYEVEEGKRYRIQFGTIYGNRFKGIVTDTDVRTLTQGDSITGQGIGTNSPTSYTSATFTAEVTGYLVIFKDADNTNGILTYMFDYEKM